MNLLTEQSFPSSANQFLFEATSVDEKRAQLQRMKMEAHELTIRLSPEARQIFQAEVYPGLMEKFSSPVLQDLFRVDYRDTPVSIRQFCEDPYFLGQSLSDELFPRILDDLEELFDGEYYEVLLAGGIGWGKSRMAEVGLAYDLYRLSCLHDPAVTFGLIPGSTLALLNVATTKSQATKVLFSGLFGYFRRSPYFRKKFPYAPNLTSEIRFPNNITCYPVASTENSMLGEGVFSAAFDEMNFMSVVKNSKSRPDGGTFDQAQALYTRLSRRIQSRTNQRGRLPGHLWLISSSRYPNDFTERKERDIIDGKAPHTFFRRYATWETHPADKFMKERFMVEVGDTTKRTRVLDGTEPDVNQQRVFPVPEDFRPQFELDPDEAARDILGRAVLSIKPFIARRDLVKKMFEMGKAIGLQHPMPRLTCTLDENDIIDPLKLHWVTERKNGKEIRRVHPGPYFAHVDLAKNRDAAGVAIGHVVGYKDVKRGIGPEMHVERRAMIRVDLLLRVVAPPHGEIQAADIRALIYRMAEIGCQFGLITYDSWGSHESLQLLAAQGYSVDNYSLDTDASGYEVAKLSIYDERVLCYDVPVLQTELASLMQTDKGKIDHPPNGSKDLADAFAGMVEHCDRHYVATQGNEAMLPSKQKSNNRDSLMDRFERGETLTEEEFDQL